MAKIIQYYLCSCTERETGEEPQATEALLPVTMQWSEKNEQVAAREAYNGVYTIEDDGVEEPAVPTRLDRVEAQVAYTAMLTDTLLEV